MDRTQMLDEIGLKPKVIGNDRQPAGRSSEEERPAGSQLPVRQLTIVANQAPE